jgi:DNA-binding GntR family transcriptional regulator
MRIGLACSSWADLLQHWSRVVPAQSIKPDAPIRSLHEHIYLTLRDDITEGRIRPGERLVELALAERFGVSQGPVREALRRLGQEGLLVTQPRRGTRVRELTLAEIDDIFEMRAELESWAARRFVARRTPASCAALVEAFAALEEAGRTANATTVVDRDLELHAALCAGAGSPLLLSTWRSIIIQWRGMRTIVASQNRSDARGTVESHRHVVASLLEGDAGEAAAEVRAHIVKASRELREFLMAAPPNERLYAAPAPD